jgi:cystathionine beta-lyase
MDVPLAPPVAAALHTAIDAGDTGYRPGRPQESKIPGVISCTFHALS